MALSLREMEVLRAVLQAGSITGGAQVLGISQPAVSRIVRDAERAVGVQLFERDPGAGVRPTAELDVLGRAIERVFLDVDGARELGQTLRLGAGRVIRLALAPSLVPAILPPAAVALRAAFPRSTLVVKVREPAPIQEAILRRDFDIGLVVHATPSVDLEFEALCAAPAVCLLPPNHPLASRSAVGPGDLAGETLISFTGERRTGAALDQVFAAHGCRREVAIEAGNSSLAAPLVQAGLGVALVDPFLVGTPALGQLIVRAFTPKVEVVPEVVTLRGHRRTAPEAALIAALHASAAAWIARNQQIWQIGDQPPVKLRHSAAMTM